MILMRNLVMGVMGFGSIWMFMGLIGLLVFTVWMVRLLFPQQDSKSVLNTAHKRLAKGEISHEEVEGLRHDLS